MFPRKPPRKADRKVPVVTAVFALFFVAVLALGLSAVIVSRIGATSDDIGLHIDGTWEIETPTYNDEHISFVFAGDSFSSVTESIIFDAGPEVIEDIREFHMLNSRAAVEAEYVGNNSYLIRVTADGTFAIDGGSILLISGEGLVRRLPFYWESDAIVIDGDRFIRR